MKKIYRYLIAAVLPILVACAATCQTESDPESKKVVVGSYDSTIVARKVDIGKHEYYLVYATCDGRTTHSVRTCGNNHCFLRHSPDCFCRKTGPAESMIVTEETESTDPFDW